MCVCVCQHKISVLLDAEEVHIFLAFRSLAVGTKTGYKLFSFNSVDKLENIYDIGE